MSWKIHLKTGWWLGNYPILGHLQIWYSFDSCPYNFPMMNCLRLVAGTTRQFSQVGGKPQEMLIISLQPPECWGALTTSSSSCSLKIRPENMPLAGTKSMLCLGSNVWEDVSCFVLGSNLGTWFILFFRSTWLGGRNCWSIFAPIHIHWYINDVAISTFSPKRDGYPLVN